MSGKSDTLSLMESAFSEEYRLYQQLLDFSEQQIETLRKEAPNLDKVAALMDRKISLLNEIRDMEERHRPIKQQWEREFESFPPEQRSRLASWKEILINLFERLQGLEDEIEKAVRIHTRELNRQLNLIYKGRTATRAYFQSEAGPSRYIDKMK